MLHMTIDMVIRLAVACFFVASAIFFAEIARINKWVSGERARKIIHILVGVWGAWLPIWLGWRSIVSLGVLLFIGVLVTDKLKLFKSIHSVSRSTAGEYFFPLTMIVMALFFKNEAIFASSMLLLGLADGLAAVIGTRYGKKTRFRIRGNVKSKHGTVTFFVIAVCIVLWGMYMQNSAIVGDGAVTWSASLVIATGIASVLTVAELVSEHGLDNITVPLLNAVALTILFS